VQQRTTETAVGEKKEAKGWS